MLEHVRKLKGSLRSIDNVISMIRVHCRINDIEWLSDGEQYKFAALVKELKFRLIYIGAPYNNIWRNTPNLSIWCECCTSPV